MRSESDSKLISVIMPAFNAAATILEAMESVLNQTYSNLELIVINDGSIDDTQSMVCSMKDPRIRYIHQENQGVSVARNKGLSLMTGDYFCFLDADDLMPKRSIESRIEVFDNNPDLAFVGGAQEQWDSTLTEHLVTQLPSYWGPPRERLLRLDSGCFINCGTWLIRKDDTRQYRFPEGWTHAEDLGFFLSISDQGNLGFTHETVQLYRRSSTSAMANLIGLANGYRAFLLLVKKQYQVSFRLKVYLRIKLAKILFLSFLAEGKVLMGVAQVSRLLIA